MFAGHSYFLPIFEGKYLDYEKTIYYLTGTPCGGVSTIVP